MIEGFGRALRLLREAAGLSQREVARRCHEVELPGRPGRRVTQAMVSQWERGEQMPSLMSLAALLRSLGVGFEHVGWALSTVREVGQGDGGALGEKARDQQMLEEYRWRCARESLSRQWSLLRRALEAVEQSSRVLMEDEAKRLRVLGRLGEGRPRGW